MDSLHLDFQHYGMVPASVILRKDDDMGRILAYHRLNMEFTQVLTNYYGDERAFSLVINGIHIQALRFVFILLLSNSILIVFLPIWSMQFVVHITTWCIGRE
jgi:hypothetical protein